MSDRQRTVLDAPNSLPSIIGGVEAASGTNDALFSQYMGDICEFLERVDQRLSRIEETLNQKTEPITQKEMYTVPEVAKLLGKQPFTIREWCRLGRIHAEKADCGRGYTKEWRISCDELSRYRNHGLLPFEGYKHLK